MVSLGIAGGGIGGLTLALACHEAGLRDVTVYEREADPKEVGAGVQLSPNATRVLGALKLNDALREIASYPQAVHLRTWRTSYLLATRPLGQFSEARYGAPYFHVHRGDLLGLLLAAVRDRGIPVRTGSLCLSAGQDDRGAWLELKDGRVRHDAIVGADGIHSAVQASLVAAGQPRYTGYVAWRGLVPATGLPDALTAPKVTVWLGPGKHFVHYPVRRGELVNFIGVVESDTWTEESWQAPGDAADLAADFAGWGEPVTRLIAAAGSTFRWALYDRDPLQSWGHGRITLLGDACHPMLPYLAQGTAMAIEDAWVLSRLLERWEDEPAQGFAEYQRYRLPRTARAQLSARDQGIEYHLSERMAVLKRNAKLTIGSRLLPEMAMSRFDWLHGYDCVRGFD